MITDFFSLILLSLSLYSLSSLSLYFLSFLFCSFSYFSFFSSWISFLIWLISDQESEWSGSNKWSIICSISETFGFFSFWRPSNLSWISFLEGFYPDELILLLFSFSRFFSLFSLYFSSFLWGFWERWLELLLMPFSFSLSSECLLPFVVGMSEFLDLIFMLFVVISIFDGSLFECSESSSESIYSFLFFKTKWSSIIAVFFYDIMSFYVIFIGFWFLRDFWFVYYFYL